MVFPCYAADPVITGVTGTTQLVVAGSNFGTPHTPDAYDYFVYSADWSCNQCNNTCTDPQAQTGISWGALPVGTADCTTQTTSADCPHMQYGNDLYTISDHDPMYSTGRSYVQWREYYLGAQYGLPNGSMEYVFSSGQTEVFIIYQSRFAADWPLVSSQYRPAQDKHCILSLDRPEIADAKITGAWARRDDAMVQYEVSSDDVSGPGTTGEDMSCIDCIGYGAFTNRANNVDYNTSITHGKIYQIKIHVKLNTFTDGSPNADGVVECWVDDTKVIDDNTVILIETEGTTISRYVIRSNWSQSPAQGPPDALGFGENEEYYLAYSNVLLNLSSTDPSGGVFPAVPCLYLSNSATWGDGPTDKLNGDASFVRQVIGETTGDLGLDAWGNTQVTFQKNTNGLNTEQTIYAYVLSPTGEVNATGFDIGEEGEPEPTPVTPSRSSGSSPAAMGWPGFY